MSITGYPMLSENGLPISMKHYKAVRPESVPTYFDWPKNWLDTSGQKMSDVLQNEVSIDFWLDGVTFLST